MAHYCVNCGSELVRREIEGRSLEACPNDDFVLWRDPKVATAVVVESDGGIVLGRRAIEPAYGMWCLPGGFVNDDESPVEAAVRECLEEICAAVVVTGLIGVSHLQARRREPHRSRLSRSSGRRPPSGSRVRDAGGRGVSARRAAAARVLEPPPDRGRVHPVPGAAGGRGTSSRRRRGSACIAAITSASPIAATAHAVKPAA